jgi:multidrug efflux pump subunit AcrA (membrane-fusion protein)
MSTALERLADLVRQAESKTRAQKLGAEAHHAVERLRAADARMREADARIHHVRPARIRDLQKSESDEVMLKELMKKLAHTLANLNPDQQREAEQEILAAQQEIASMRREAQIELDEATQEFEAARKELRGAQEHYLALRREMDQILPDMAADYLEDDRLARGAEQYFPLGQIQALAREIEDGERHFGMLEAREQYAQLKIWIGRFRRLQAIAERDPAGPSEDDHARLREIFPRLVGISKEYMPGYIEAFSRAFETDWDAYVAEATEQLRQATDGARRDREFDERRRESLRREAPRLRPHPREERVRGVDVEEVKELTRGRHAVLVGGEAREERRRQLEQVFGFESLDWVPSEGSRPFLLRTLEQRIRAHEVDLVMLLGEFVGHAVSETLGPVCAAEQVVCLVLDQGDSPAQIADAIRRTLGQIQQEGDPASSQAEANGH